MANDIDDSFVKQFEAEVHLTYQQMGSKMANTVRRKMNVTGQSTTFQKIGQGEAGTKSRNGDVPIFNLDHDPIECTLTDYYGGEYVDKLDELKIQHDERGATSTSIAAALGRKSDNILITSMTAGAGAATAATTGTLSKSKVQEAVLHFGENEVPVGDGNAFLAVSPAGWIDLLGDAEFTSADYIGSDQLPYKGVMAKEWLGFFIYQINNLNSPSGTVRDCLAYHRSAAGLASGAEVGIDITWQGTKQAHLVVGSMSQGACVIDSKGVFKVQFTE